MLTQCAVVEDAPLPASRDRASRDHVRPAKTLSIERATSAEDLRPSQDALRRTAWTDADADRRSRSLFALSPRDPANLQFVRDVYRRDPSPAVRRRALLKLTDWGRDPLAVDTLIEALERESDVALRARAALALALVHPTADRRALVEAALARAEAASDPGLRSSASFARNQAIR